MKILLVLPPEEYRRLIPQLGIMYISSFLKEKGFNVDILDCKALDLDFDKKDSYKIINNSIYKAIDWEVVESRIREIGPDLVGISAMTNNINNSHEVAKIIKKINKNIPVVIGGVHATCVPLETMQEFPSFDILVRGEGEEIMAELSSALKHKSALNQIKGILFRENGEIRENPAHGELEDLSSLPYPDYDSVPLDKYTRFIKETNYLDNIDTNGFFLSSRGCPYRCTFCASVKVHGHKLRERSVENILNELKLYKDKYGTRNFWFWDDTLTVNKKKLMNLCDRIVEEKLNIAISCYARVNTMSDDLAFKMKKAGFKHMYFGIESGSERVLKDIRKDITLTQAREAVKICARRGLYVTAGFMIGHPTDTKESIEQTIKFAKSLIPLGVRLVAFWIAIPLPGTDMFKQVKDKLVSLDWRDYFYQDSNMFQVKPVFSPEGCTPEELITYQKRAHKEFKYEFIKHKLLNFDFPYLFGAIFRKISKLVYLLRK